MWHCTPLMGEHLGYTFTHGGRNGTLDGQLTRVDLQGRQLWARSFGDPSGGVGPSSALMAEIRSSSTTNVGVSRG